MDISMADVSRPRLDPTPQRTSPPGSSTSSPQKMLPHPPIPFSMASSGRTPGQRTQLPPMGSPSPGGYSVIGYSHSFGTSSSSSNAALGSLQDTPINESMNMTGAAISPTNMSAAGFNGEKRKYRQRRKDPSCDACRERKVKCDATETSPCSECSSRNHKCQFTKETNRRMSSIKQVQDLQSQLIELKEENMDLRTRVADRSPPRTINRPILTTRRQDVLALETPEPLQPPVMQNFDAIRMNVRAYSIRVFASTAPEPHTKPAGGLSNLPEIPPRPHYAHVSRSYIKSIHEWFPVLHWPMFQHEVDQVYANRTFEGRTMEWVGLFFVVMACGTLQTPLSSFGSVRGQPPAWEYYNAAKEALSPHPEIITMDYAKAALLMSIFTMESNMKSTASLWLASAVRSVQMLGLQFDRTARHPVEAEMRRRLWWSVYTWDRSLSLGAGLPMLISENDYNVTLPSTVEDRYIISQANFPLNSVPFTGFLAVSQVARLYSSINQALKSSVIPQSVLQELAEKIASTLLLLPETYRAPYKAPLEPDALPVVFQLHVAHFLLCRRNLSPVCRPTERADALRRCGLVALDTAKSISRTWNDSLDTPYLDINWVSKMTQQTSTMICMHIWRCILMLCFVAEYEAALVCVRLSSAIGDFRRVNTACGKNIEFFLDRLLDKVHQGHGSFQRLAADEEIIAYVSADMQWDLDQSWIWEGTDLDAAQQVSSPSSTSLHSSIRLQGTKELMQGTHLPLRPGSGSPRENRNEAETWNGWAGVEQQIRQLMEEQRPRLGGHAPPSYYPTPHNPVKRIQLASNVPANSLRSTIVPQPSPTPSGTSRISIANII